MKKILLGCLMLFMVVSFTAHGFPNFGCTRTFASESQWLPLIEKRYQEIFAASGTLFPQWKEYIKNKYDLDLAEIVSKSAIVRQEPCPNVETQIHVFVSLGIRLLCTDSQRVKKTVYVKRVTFIEIDKEKKCILGGGIVDEDPWTVSDGWNGKDT